MDHMSVWVALGGGVVSLISPCTLPMIPVYVATVAGPTAAAAGGADRRFQILLHSLIFVLGFSLVFVLLGSGVALVGVTLKTHIILVRQISGGLMIFFGLFMLASQRLSWLNFEKRLAATNLNTGYWRAGLIGVLFALAWSPCAGPVLGSILTLAFQSGSGWQGAYLLSFYSLGIALPFLALGLGLDFIQPWMKRIGRFSLYIFVLSGLLLIAMGALIVTNHLTWFSG
jgi:cytochrome c-type biogenesis protein